MAALTIPRIIHCFWTSGNGATAAVPTDIEGNLSEWRRLHPTFELKIWSLDEVRSELADVHTRLLASIDVCRFAAMASDIIRLALLCKYGGFWTDLKNCPQRSFLDALTCISDYVVAEHTPSESRPDPEDYLCNVLMGCPPEHPFARRCLAVALDNVGRRAAGSVFSVTGGDVIMRERRRSPDGVVVLRWQYIWGEAVRRTSGSYNANGQHWSVRQKTESLYLDVDMAEA